MYITTELNTITQILIKHKDDKSPYMGIFAQGKAIVWITDCKIALQHNLIASFTVNELRKGLTGSKWNQIQRRIRIFKELGTL